MSAQEGFRMKVEWMEVEGRVDFEGGLGFCGGVLLEKSAVDLGSETLDEVR